VIPVELELQNFLAYRDPSPLSFKGIHIACLAGPNGAGKSSLLDAMTWAMWGKARSNSPGDLIHHGGDHMRVALTFDQEGNSFRVVRQWKASKRGTSILEFHGWDEAAQDWNNLSAATIRQTQEQIDSLLRMDYETFVNSALLMQGRADEFTTKTPSQRKQVLANILGLSQWERYESRAKDRISEVKSEILRLDGWLESIQRELDTEPQRAEEFSTAEKEAEQAAEALIAAEKQWSDLEQARKDMVAVQRRIDELTDRIESTKRELKEGSQERESLEKQADKTAIQAALSSVREALKTLEPLRSRRDQLSEQRAKMIEESSRLRGTNEALVPQSEPLKARIETLEAADDPVCPTCGQALGDDHRRKLLDELDEEISGRRKQYAQNRDRIKELEAEVKVCDKEIRLADEELHQQNELIKRDAELESSLAHADKAAEQVKALAKRIERWRKDLQGDQSRRAEFEKQAETAERQLQSAALTQADLDKLRLAKRMADERMGGARQQMAALDELKKQRQERTRERDQLGADMGLYEELREAFGKRGVPAMIIETVVPELERDANQLLERMTEGRLHVRIETQKLTKGGDVREALDIVISDELGKRAYELYSGGEAFRIDFAIRIALSQLLARRAGAQLRSLFIDEGFGTQDARGREYLVDAISSIQDDFDRILVITHIDELKDAFPSRIEVRKTTAGSQFELM
jgi:exonuclease SbcC